MMRIKEITQKEKVMNKLNDYVFGHENIKALLINTIEKHFVDGKPQRLLICDADYRAVWNMIQYISDFIDFSPTFWNMRSIKGAEEVNEVLQITADKHDKLTERRDAHHIADIDLMSNDTCQAIINAMDGEEFKTEKTEKIINTRDMLFVLSTEKTMKEVQEQFGNEFISEMTAILQSVN